jgi:hypothetical protein
VPVSHAEYEWQVRGPKVNADVSWYFGIDGKAEFRTMDTLNQAWVLGRHAHEHREADAVEVTRLAGKMSIVMCTSICGGLIFRLAGIIRWACARIAWRRSRGR